MDVDAIERAPAARRVAAHGQFKFVFDRIGTNPPYLSTGSKRRKYTSRACQDCRRRKVKCSGEDICRHCRARKVPCTYIPEDRMEFSKNPIDTDPPVPQSERHIEPGLEANETAVDISSEHQHTSANSIPTPSKDGGLNDRVWALERMMAHVVESSKVSACYPDRIGDSPSSTYQPSLRPHLADDEDEDNMFAARQSGPDDLSLSSQVAAMGAFLSKPASPIPISAKQPTKSEILIEFPEPPLLQYLLDVYFRDLDCYFPFLDRQRTEERIYDTIRRLGYSSYNRMLLVASQDLSLIAMTCLMLALAECLDSGEGACDPDMPRPGWRMYLHGCRAVQRFFYSKDVDLDVVRAQCLVAAYLMHAELLRPASLAISVVFQLATAIKLNNQHTWSSENADEVASKQSLWWTIYFLDRRIAQKSGLAYHIRDTEFYVEDFEARQNGNTDGDKEEAEWLSSSTRQYVQALITLARLWSQIWDTFFAVGATKTGDWLEIEIMDTKIRNAYRKLPESLQWESAKLIDYVLQGESEPHVRRRVHIYTRFNLLRMLIRQNPLRQSAFDPETASHCARLSRDVIQAHDVFASRYPAVRASGYFATATLVECVYHLAPVLHSSRDGDERQASVAALKLAHNILIQLSTKVNVAKKALKALSGVILRWSSERNPSDTPGLTLEVDGYRGIAGDAQNQDRFANQCMRQNMLNEDWINMPMSALFGNDLDFNLTS